MVGDRHFYGGSSNRVSQSISSSHIAKCRRATNYGLPGGIEGRRNRGGVDRFRRSVGDNDRELDVTLAQRGDLVTVSLQGELGRPRPARAIQSDLLTELESVMPCPITSELKNAAFRVTLEPNPANGLRALSQCQASFRSRMATERN